MTNRISTKMIQATALIGASVPALALAHPGHGGHVEGGFMAGLMHPLTGADHLSALLLFGALLAGISLKHKGLALSAAAISLAAGFAGGVAFGGHVASEWLIMASVLVFAGALAFPAGTRGKAATVVAALLAAHGWAHGVEMTGSLMHFGSGFMVTSVALMLAGLPLGQLAQRTTPALRGLVAGGAAVALMLAAG